MLDAINGHPQAKAVLGPVFSGSSGASHAYLFHGPAGSGRAEIAEALAVELLARGSDRDDTAIRVKGRTHPDLEWIVPEGANGEILVDDIRDRIVAAVPLRPFEAECRIFVVEAADRMNESAANAFLKTLEEPPDYAHIILIADSPAAVQATIVSRCQRVRFERPSAEAVAARLERSGVSPATAKLCARLADGDAARAELLASEEGEALRNAGQRLARAALSGQSATARPWMEIVAASAERGKAAQKVIEDSTAARLEVAAKSERTRITRDAEERGKRARRRAESEAADAALHVAQLWLRDVHRVAVGADAAALPAEVRDDAASADPAALRRAIELVDRTRSAMRLNIGRELAIEALSHRLNGALR